MLGLMVAASNVIAFGLMHMRPLQWWLRTTWVFPEGQPISQDQGHAAMLTVHVLDMWNKPWFLSQGPVLGAPCPQGSLTPPEGAQLIASSLSTEVVETILQSRAPSTRKLCNAKWQLFTSWCHSHQLDPVECPIVSVLEFLQDRFDSGLSSSTPDVYMAAIVAHHSPVSYQSLERNLLVTRFLLGIWRLRPPVPPSIPTLDLAVVLDALSKSPCYDL